MKKIIALVLTATIALSFVGCGTTAKKEIPGKASVTDNEGIATKPSTGEGDNDGDELVNNSIFRGTILKIEDDEAIIEPDKGEDILSSGDKVRVYIGDHTELNLKEGDKVVITHKGDVMESYPLQINLIDIEKAENLDSQSISSDADDSNFVDWKDVLYDSIGVEVQSIIDEYQKTADVKVKDSIGIMLSGLYAEGYQWKVEIDNEEVLKFIKQGKEKGVVGERQGYDFFVFKALKQGESKVKISVVEGETGKVASEYSFQINVK